MSKKNSLDINENPWTSAKIAWNYHEGYVVASKRRWQIVGLAFGFIAMIAVAGIIFIGSQSKFVPYVVQVDKLGEAVAIRKADIMAPIDKRVIIASLSNFIHDLRTVTIDIALQKQFVFRVYSYLNSDDTSAQKTSEFYSADATSPFKRAEKETVDVTINSVFPMSDKTWQVYWTEDVRNRKGQLTSKKKYRANITFTIANDSVKRTEEDIQKNPMGLFIRDYFIADASEK